MSPLPALGSRQYQTPSPANAALPGQAGAGAKTTNAGGSALMQRTGQDAVSLSKNGIDLSAQGMADRTDALGNATLDVAQDFLASFAQRLLGDSAQGATVTFDSASLSAEAGFAGLIQHSQGPHGSRDGAAFSLSESSHFVGKGKITTEDGQSFEFEIEVQYESRIEAAAVSDSGTARSRRNDKEALPTAQLPDVDFPGSLDELFKLLGKQLQTDLPDPAAQNGETAGTLTVRMLNLINHSTQLDALDKTAVPDDAKARAKALAEAYGTPKPPVDEAILLAPVPPAPDSAEAANATQ